MTKPEYIQSINFHIGDSIEVYNIFNREGYLFRLEMSSFKGGGVTESAFKYNTATECFTHICLNLSKRKKCELNKVVNSGGETFISEHEEKRILKKYGFDVEIIST